MSAYGTNTYGAKRYGAITGGGDVTYRKKKTDKNAVTEPISSFNRKYGGQKNVMTSPTANTVGIAKKPVAYDNTSGGYSIRNAFENSGLDASKLQYDGEYVSYNGQKLKPMTNVNGTTYASMQDINDFIARSYGADGRRLVQANEATNPYGIDALDWNSSTKQMTVGGKPVNYAYIDENGNAWVDEEELAGAYDEYAQLAGLSSPEEAYDGYEERMAAYDRMRDDVLSEKWSYTEEDLQNDVAYQAYKAMYEREAQRAHDDMLGQMAARNGGALSSSAQLAAGQSYYNQMQGLNDRVPELAQMAYERWLNDKTARISDIQSREQSAYNRYLAQENASQTAYDREQARREAAYQRMYEPLNRQAAELEVKSEQQDLRERELTYAQTAIENSFANAVQRGYFTDEEARILGLERNADGSLPSPYSAEVAYLKYKWDNYERPQLDYEYAQKAKEEQTAYQNELGLLGVKNSNDLAKMAAQYEYDKLLKEDDLLKYVTGEE